MLVPNVSRLLLLFIERRVINMMMTKAFKTALILVLSIAVMVIKTIEVE